MKKTKQCVGCGFAFIMKQSNKEYCSRKCMHKYKNKDYNERKRKEQSLTLHNQKTEFDETKYRDKIISYDSPTGTAYIGFAKHPLMNNETGFGYKGVLLQSANRALVQCAECGEWMKFITPFHLKEHQLTTQEYKEKFGLNDKTGLISDVLGNRLAQQVDEVINSKGKRPNYKDVSEQMHKRNKEITKAGLRKKIKGTMEQKNKWGTCPEQLKYETFEYIRRFKRLPKNCSLARGGFSKAKTLISRFGSLNMAMKEYGLPTRYKTGQITTYVFGDFSYTHKIGQDYDVLYQLLIARCPEFATHVNNINNTI